MTRFGIEEEFQLLDEDTLVPVPLGAAAQSAVPSGAGKVTTEFLTSQVEFSTSPVDSMAAAREQLSGFRQALAAFAREHRVVASGSGTPYGVGPAGSVAASERYAAISHWLGHIVDGHHVNAMHLHVEVVDEERRVHALNVVRGWLPTLQALSGNSPFADARDTGHESWRTVIMRRFPLAGSPPHFRGMDHYRSMVNRLIAQDVIPDVGSVCWAARLSNDYPTVEVRLFDAQLTTEDSLLLAALGRAVVDASASQDAPPPDDDAIQTSLWGAARRGLAATLVHPATGALIPARDAVELLLQTVAPALQARGDLEVVQHRVGQILQSGTGAQRQRTAFTQGGIPALRELLRAETEWQAVQTAR